MASVLLFVHILAAGAWFGASVVQMVTNRRMAASSDEVAATWLRTVVSYGNSIYLPSALLLLVTGVWMVLINDAYGFGNLFVTIGFVMVVIGAVFGARIFGPLSEQAADLREQGNSAEAQPLYVRLRTAGMIDGLLLTVTIAAMVGRWGA